MSPENDSKAARAARAEKLRQAIRDLAQGKKPPGAGPLSPREITDEAAREAANETKPGTPRRPKRSK